MPTATPARQGSIDRSDGRRVAYAEFGDLDGRPVVLLHGNPGSRLFCPDLAATVDAGVRLVTFDRPGMGQSDRRPFHRLRDVADDVAELAAHLGIAPFQVIGWSGGAPFALATAAFHPQLVTDVVVLSGSGLPDDPDVLAARPDEVGQVIEGVREGSLAALEAAESRFAPFADNPRALLDEALENDTDPDRHLMIRPDVQTALVAMWEEGGRQGSGGLADSWAAIWALPWEFDPGGIIPPVAIWHGTEDQIVDIGQAQRLADAIPDARMHALPGVGHLLALAHWGEILAATA